MLEPFWKAERTRRHGASRAWTLLWILFSAATMSPAGAASPAGAERSPSAPRGVLHLRRGDIVAGRFVDHADSGRIAWQHPAFEAAFLLPLRAVTSAAFAEPERVERAAGEFCIELINGDRWYGSLVGIDDRILTVRSPALGDLLIRREMVRRLFRWGDGDTLLYSGPGKLDSWQQAGGQWEDRGGQLRTDQTLAAIYSDIGIPAQAELEIGISWSGSPNFAIHLGVDEDLKSADRALRVEVWNRTLVLVHESETAAAVLPLGAVADFDEQLWLSIVMDQTTGRTIVYSQAGERLGELDFEGAARPPLPGIRLENISGNVQLDSLQVLAGRNLRTAVTPANRSRLQLIDDETLEGRLLRVEGESWVVAEGEQERTVDPATVLAAEFDAGADPTGPPAGNEGRVRVATYSGIRGTGSLEKIEDERLYLRAEGVDGLLPLRIAELRSLSVLESSPEQGSASDALFPERSDTDSAPAQATDSDAAGRAARIGRLELNHPTSHSTGPHPTRLHGRLVDAKATDETSGLRFRPLDAAEAAALRSDASGRLVYRDPKPEPTVERPERPQPANQGILGAFVNAFGGGGTGGGSAAVQPGVPSLHLRSGDVLPGEVTRIDEEGVVFESPAVGATHLPHDQIRAVTFSGGKGAGIDDRKRKRLLTVPRMRKATPPTHLIVSSDGDFLRGRLHRLDEQMLQFENRLETIEIPRRVVAQIIWFHADELSDEEPPEKPAATRLRVQSVHRNGVRLTFEPREVGGGEMIGDSPQLGVCLVRLGTVDQLLIGREIDAGLSDSPYYDWRLTHAPEPKTLAADEDGEGSGMRSAGIDSPLIGTAAPDFDLELLSGDTFRLSEQRGKVVVLDFWATWCGPCIQSMPQVEDAVAAFSGDGVILVAVNLQEPAEQIRGTLERLKRNPTVAMDIDGVVASRYHATAIPQTVVIDREGRVTRLFIGGGARLGEHLREAIEEAATPP